MLKQFLNHIHQNNLFKPGSKILLAVSGGLDSMVMLHLFSEAGFSFGVAHCNFQLRGEDSQRDEAFVKQACSDKNLKFYSNRFETEDYASDHGLSVQMAARDLRYAWFSEVAEKEGYDFLATAHHLNDSLETILLNLTKGSGIQGLSGIPLKNGKIIRPMLFASHDMIKSYAESNQIKWREDLSNSTDDYQRNFIRHQVVPKLKELNPSMEDTFQKSLAKIYGALELMKVGKAEFERQFKPTENGVHIPKIVIEQVENSAAVLWELIHHYGFNLEQCQSIVEALHGQPGKKFPSAGFQLTIDRTELVISKHPENWEPVSVEQGHDHVTFGPFSITIKSVQAAVQLNQDKHEGIFDADTLKFPLTWRKWKAGDHFYPMGLEHKKKLSDFLIDNKVSLPAKGMVTVLESAGEIVWVVGHRIDNRFKITPQTRQAISFFYSTF